MFRLSLVLCMPCLLLVSGCDKVRNLIGDFVKTGDPEAASLGPAAPVRDLSGSEYGAFLMQKDKLVVVDFHADWCGPCVQLAPILEKVAAEYGDLVRIGKIDVDQERETAAQAGVRSIPDVRFYRDGKQVDQFVGLPPEGQIRSKFETHSKGLTPGASGDAAEGTSQEEAIQPMGKDWLPPGMERR